MKGPCKENTQSPKTISDFPSAVYDGEKTDEEIDATRSQASSTSICSGPLQTVTLTSEKVRHLDEVRGTARAVREWQEQVMKYCKEVGIRVLR